MVGEDDLVESGRDRYSLNDAVYANDRGAYAVHLGVPTGEPRLTQHEHSCSLGAHAYVGTILRPRDTGPSKESRTVSGAPETRLFDKCGRCRVERVIAPCGVQDG